MSDEPLYLVAAGNTQNPCLVLLRRKGYSIHVQFEESTERLNWFASGPGGRFLADNPHDLLGLVTMGEYFGRDWKAEMENVLMEVLMPKGTA
jgi:hypothetical protein